MPSFGQLTVIILAGLGGPLLSASRRVIIPVVVGELLAGIVLGKTGAGLIKAGDPTISFLGDMGFAVLMMVAGMHVPLRNRALTRSLGRGAVAVVASIAVGLGGGLAIAHGLGVGQVSGVANGFLVPLFFVVLGASLNVRALVRTPTSLELAGALIAGMVIVHLIAGLVIRAPAWVALIVTAQLGVPAAVVKLGLADGVLRAGQGAAIILAALASLGICAAGTAIANSAGARGASPSAASARGSPAQPGGAS
jgi:Kef-type K+ transport system membrane component KefB